VGLDIDCILGSLINIARLSPFPIFPSSHAARYSQAENDSAFMFLQSIVIGVLFPFTNGIFLSFRLVSAFPPFFFALDLYLIFSLYFH
jgi:hypothetical protein